MKILILFLIIICTSCITNKSPNASRKHNKSKYFTKAYSGSNNAICVFNQLKLKK